MDGALVTVHLVRWVRLVRYGRYVLCAWYGMAGTVQQAPYQAGKKPYHRTVPINRTRLRGGLLCAQMKYHYWYGKVGPLNVVRFIGTIHLYSCVVRLVRL